MSAEFVEGVYYEEKILTGGLREQVKYWAREGEEGYIVVEYLKLSGASTGMEADRLSPEVFEKRFEKFEEEKSGEPEKTAKEKTHDKHIREGEIHLEKSEHFSAQFEYKQAIKIDKAHVGANFGLGKAYLAGGDKERAKEVFAGLVENEKLYEKENKHHFNKLGIELRRQEMYEEAIENYRRALDIDPHDAILYYNLARAHYHKGEREDAMAIVHKALGLDPALEDAKKLLDRIESGENAGDHLAAASES